MRIFKRENRVKIEQTQDGLVLQKVGYVKRFRNWILGPTTSIADLGTTIAIFIQIALIAVALAFPDIPNWILVLMVCSMLVPNMATIVANEIAGLIIAKDAVSIDWTIKVYRGNTDTIERTIQLSDFVKDIEWIILSKDADGKTIQRTTKEYSEALKLYKDSDNLLWRVTVKQGMIIGDKILTSVIVKTDAAHSSVQSLCYKSDTEEVIIVSNVGISVHPYKATFDARSIFRPTGEYLCEPVDSRMRTEAITSRKDQMILDEYQSTKYQTEIIDLRERLDSMTLMLALLASRKFVDKAEHDRVDEITTPDSVMEEYKTAIGVVAIVIIVIAIAILLMVYQPII